MFLANQKSTGTCYTTSAAFLVVALVFCPALLAFIRPIGNLAVGLLVSAAVTCLALAWLCWRWFSRLTLPSLEKER